MKSIISALLLGSVVVFAAGCGSGQQTYSKQPIKDVTVAENVRNWLNGVATSGQLDSGATIMRGEIEKLRADTTVKVDDLLKGYDDLMAAKSPQQRKTKAQELIKLLPA